jgi:hypothetical protein
VRLRARLQSPSSGGIALVNSPLPQRWLDLEYLDFKQALVELLGHLGSMQRGRSTFQPRSQAPRASWHRRFSRSGDSLIRSPASSASVAHRFIDPWRADVYAGGSRFSSFVTSGDFNGSSPLQSRHRNLRPPAFTSVHRMGLLHLRQRGGGRFLTTMMLTLNWAGAQNSQSPIEAEDGAVMKAA